MEAEARKTLNMVQQWTAATDYTLAELGIQEWVTKANQSAAQVLQLVSVRVENESAKVKGELADARKATDAAIRSAYDIVNALNVIQPSDALTQLTTLLLGIEERAKLYYISSGKKTEPEPQPDGGDEPAPGGDDSGDGDSGGEVTPVTPE